MKTALSLILALAAHSASAAVIKIDGSSTVFPVTEAVAEEFQKNKKGEVQVTVGISGTGGGFKKFCRGETDVQNASRPILKEEMDTCKQAKVEYFELPIAFDALTVVIHPDNKWAETMTVDDLKKIWEPEAQGKITKWNQVRPEWPDAEIKLYGAGADSGTFDYFTEAVNGKSKKSRGDYTASEDDNTLVQGISRDKNALGYLPYSYYEANKKKLKAVAIDGGAKAPKKGGVLPNRASVEGGIYFPLSRPIFIYVSAQGFSKKEVKEFTEFYIKEGGKLAAEVKYIPLQQKAYALAADILKKGRKGTVFGGHAEIGLKIEELLKRETKL